MMFRRLGSLNTHFWTADLSREIPAQQRRMTPNFFQDLFHADVFSPSDGSVHGTLIPDTARKCTRVHATDSYQSLTFQPIDPGFLRRLIAVGILGLPHNDTARVHGVRPVSYTHLTLPTIYSV